MKYLDSKLGKGIARVAMASYLAGSVAGCATPQVTAFGYTLNNPKKMIKVSAKTTLLSALEDCFCF